MWSRNNQASMERNRRRLEAGLVSKHFPDVARIVIHMVYNQRGSRSLLRTLNFYPGSHAFFRIECLSDDCVDGGFDLTHIINSMIRSHSEETKGELSCDDVGPRPNHSDIVYEVAIQYT